MISDYFCKDENKIFKYKKEMGKAFPHEIVCPSCGAKIPREFSPPIVSVAIGGIVHGADYVPSDYTPLSKVHGRSSSWVENGS